MTWDHYPAALFLGIMLIWLFRRWAVNYTVAIWEREDREADEAAAWIDEIKNDWNGEVGEWVERYRASRYPSPEVTMIVTSTSGRSE